jgi:hypothetical protein
MVLVWNWVAPNAFGDLAHPELTYHIVKDIDGFHTYENDAFFNHQLVNTTSLGDTVEVSMFAPPARTLPRDSQRCYVVRAFKGRVESTDSSSFCIRQDVTPGTQTTALTLEVTYFPKAGN